MNVSSESGANLHIDCLEDTAKHGRPLADAFAGPITADWIDEAIEMLDGLETGPLDVFSKDLDLPIPVRTGGTVVAAAPAKPKRRKTAPISYGTKGPFSRPVSNWRPGTKA